MGSGGSKTAEKRGLKVQSPIGAMGGGPSVKEKAFLCWEKNIFLADIFEQLNKSYNPWPADDESSMSQGEAEAWRPMVGEKQHQSVPSQEEEE